MDLQNLIPSTILLGLTIARYDSFLDLMTLRNGEEDYYTDGRMSVGRL